MKHGGALTGKDAQSKYIWEVVGEETYHKLQAYIDIVLSGEQVFFEDELPGENGEKHYFYTVMVPETDDKGTVGGFISLSNDITQFRTMVQKIAEALEVNQKLLETSPIGIVTHNSAGQLVIDNDASTMHLGKQEAASTRPVSFEPFKLPLKRLTGREVEVLQHMADGLSNQEIAELFGVTLRTIKAHASNIFTKLMAKNRVQAVLRGRKLGILPS